MSCQLVALNYGRFHQFAFRPRVSESVIGVCGPRVISAPLELPRMGVAADQEGVYLRGLAYLHLHKGAEAAVEFHKILGHKGARYRVPGVVPGSIRVGDLDLHVTPRSRATRRKPGKPSRIFSHCGKTPIPISQSCSKPERMRSLTVMLSSSPPGASAVLTAPRRLLFWS